jgi:multidrug efflux pump subunit AcrB
MMLALASMVVGAAAAGRLSVDLLPQIVYPEIRVRVADPGVPARVMEDQVTRYLEEQLAVTEDVVAVQSISSEGQSVVDLSFPYGTDIDAALREASARLDRARRQLPADIDPPILIKRDPSQSAVIELVATTADWDGVQLRSWADDTLSKWFLTLPGVASVEVGGGLEREIVVYADQERLAGLGLGLPDLVEAIQRNNVDTPAGRLSTGMLEFEGRTAGRFQNLAELENLSVATAMSGRPEVRLTEVARVVDGHEAERLLIRLNGVPGVKLSIHKQPAANTIAVVDAVLERLQWLRSQDAVPASVMLEPVADQSLFVRQAVRNAGMAVFSGALLAMLVVYLFLGDVRRTLIIGSAIPIAVVATLGLMSLGGLSLNIMTLGGLALGVGMLVDSTIVMMENIHRLQAGGGRGPDSALQAATEVNSAIVASASTNLAAVLPFVFMGGLAGLIFRELILTLAAAIVASVVVALTLVPALAARVPERPAGRLRVVVERLMVTLQEGYARLVRWLLPRPWLVILPLLAAMLPSLSLFTVEQQEFLPEVDSAEVRIHLRGDSGVSLAEMDEVVRTVEAVVATQPEVISVYSSIGGYVYGRTALEAANRSSLTVRLVPVAARGVSMGAWIDRIDAEIEALRLAGVRVYVSPRGLPGIRLGRSDDSISLRIQGPDLDRLAALGEQAWELAMAVPQVRWVSQSMDELAQELVVSLDRDRMATLGVDASEVGDALRLALAGRKVTDFVEGDRSIPVQVRLPEDAFSAPEELASLIVARGVEDGRGLRLGELARVQTEAAPSSIRRDAQRRVLEVSARAVEGADVLAVSAGVHRALQSLSLPEGYVLYDAGEAESIREGQRLGRVLLALAVFLVYVAMAVQYESLRNPLVILLSVPFALVGVAAGLAWTETPLSMPVWLGMIMLAGIVVNNAIVLVEYFELVRGQGMGMADAISAGASTRLRPVLMTTLTTVVGMMPLALGLGDGSELLQPLALAVVCGLSFALVVSLLLVPVLYFYLARPRDGTYAAQTTP